MDEVICNAATYRLNLTHIVGPKEAAEKRIDETAIDEGPITKCIKP
jgi:hypothetical protein